jgi:hypothetical protein
MKKRPGVIAGALFQGIIASHYRRALLQGHYCRALLQGIIAGHYCRALLQSIIAGHKNSFKKLCCDQGTMGEMTVFAPD